MKKLLMVALLAAIAAPLTFAGAPQSNAKTAAPATQTDTKTKKKHSRKKHNKKKTESAATTPAANPATKK